MLDIADEIWGCLTDGRPVVALESTLICHGLPKPRNAAFAREIEAAVRGAGATPATIAVVRGRVRVGLAPDELRSLALAGNVTKASARDLPFAVASGGDAATTVAATVRVAANAGIAVMATGGIGGVHRGGEASLDVSADLGEIARQPVCVVSAGAKAILDLPRTLEVLETLGVPVIGYGCAEFPAFYASSSGLPVARVDGLAALAEAARAHFALSPGTGLLTVQPPPAAEALPADDVERLVTDALDAARSEGVVGAAETPFVLRRMAEASGGATVRVNEALALENARLAARLAAALAAGG